MTGALFVLGVKVKLNRLDTSSYEDVRPEEIYFFAHNALKQLVLQFDEGRHTSSPNSALINNYMASVTRVLPSTIVTANTLVIPDVLKFRDLEAFVKVPTTEEEGWVPTRELSNERLSDKMSNPFIRSYPDAPAYTYTEGKLKFSVNTLFSVTQIRGVYIEEPETYTDRSDITLPFTEELENLTVTLLLENLENRRLQTQAVISRT